MDSDLSVRTLFWVGFVLRLALLVPLLAGFLIAGAGMSPSGRTFQQFRSVLLAGEVDRVNYQATGSGQVASLVWSESPLVWYRMEVMIGYGGEPYTTERLMSDVRSAPVQPSLDGRSVMESSGRGIFPSWPFDLPGGWWVAGSWVVVFLVMLCSTPRLANRWAWFWMFTVGQVGVFLYLLLEPRSLWRGPGEGVIKEKRVDGSSGCGYSLLLAAGCALLAWGVGLVL